MQKTLPRKPKLGNALLFWLGIGILVLGGIFVYFYGSLRSTTLAPATATAPVSPGARSATGLADDALRDLGIDPSESDLSPEAQAAIARAHQAAVSNRSQAATDGGAPAAVQDSAGDVSPDMGSVAVPESLQ
ncbi:hypothetical protein KCG44_06055 [Pacificimonas sp. WHA3]|uniref:Uncharacterized protein n=1 Tax=Pacificimonas pallii TaxID=2827236 RepID=A0ABS6SD58_9SPHN|nr:hypothetical protein [Pacificimonas pallii]MBV7256348.1 hypothetical protein [Pacificimonas pallii]